MDIFASTTILLVKRDVMARTSCGRAFFVPYSINLDKVLAVACTSEVKPIIPHSCFSLCDRFVVGGYGGNRFLICRQFNNKSKMQRSKSTPQVGYTPAQLNFINLYLEPAKAAEAAKAIRMLCIAAVESEGDPKHIAEALFLAELLSDVSLSDKPI
jgi:hypothetical protein